MADLMHVGVQVEPIQRHVDDRRADDVVGMDGVGESAGALGEVVECDLRAAGHLDEIHADDVAPLLQRLERNRAPGVGNPLKIHRDRAGLGVEMMVVAVEEAVGEPICKLIERADRRVYIVADGQFVRAGPGIVRKRFSRRPRRDVYVISSSRRGSEDQP